MFYIRIVNHLFCIHHRKAYVKAIITATIQYTITGKLKIMFLFTWKDFNSHTLFFFSTSLIKVHWLIFHCPTPLLLIQGRSLHQRIWLSTYLTCTCTAVTNGTCSSIKNNNCRLQWAVVHWVTLNTLWASWRFISAKWFWVCWFHIQKWHQLMVCLK